MIHTQSTRSSTKTNNLGFPRIGAHRELKKALESYWSGKSEASELHTAAAALRKQHWKIQQESKIDLIPSNDFSLYDPMLDMAVTLGATPRRYQSIQDPLKRYFAMARGLQDQSAGIDLPAMEMTKWFDTNYHYIVPELEAKQTFNLNATKILSEIKEARALGIETRPVMIGPVSFLLLSKFESKLDSKFESKLESKLDSKHHSKLDEGTPSASTLDLLEALLPTYKELFKVLAAENVSWVQLDEPCLVLELDHRSVKAYGKMFSEITSWKNRPKIFTATYFGTLGNNLDLVAKSGCDALHVDLVRAPEQLDPVLSALSPHTLLSLGVVDGRNIWRTDLDLAHGLIRKAVSKLGSERVLIGPSCSLVHVPVDLELEKKLDPELKSWLSFAVQKLHEIQALAHTAESEHPVGPLIEESRAAISSRRSSTRIRNSVVRNRVQGITQSMLTRPFPYSTRASRQQTRLNLPTFPTTTIGSFPQTEEVRKARANWRSGKITEVEYHQFLKQETKHCIEKQEAIGLDVLVHGEFERTDMVEYFGEKLSGFAFTSNGWVQSYGSRCVKPPIIFGDVQRDKPITVEWSVYAQSLTKKPVKGMLTGPVTILQWSFVRDDQPRSETCMEIALALRDEVRDLESAGISVIQVDEPAIREGLPLRQSDWKTYLRWAVDAFRLVTSGVRLDTQIHTHMCYCEFGDILDSVAEMDADVISIETSRSRMELLDEFEKFRYPNEVGPGVYDIHSPRIPTQKEIVELLQKASRVIPIKNLWVNPDCGLKTRGWPEVQTALENMVGAAKSLRNL